MDDEPYILWLDDCDRTSMSLVGGKCASLGDMIKANINVPPGFAVTTAAYRDFLVEAGVGQEIQKILAPLAACPDDVEATEKASLTIRQLMGSSPIPAKIEDSICRAYQELCGECGVADLPVAVRSSATAEDLPDASFAGQQDTTLWVRSAGSVMIRTAICWSSLFTARAISYRVAMGFPHDKVLISVGVQKMANARVAGVMFTLNPSNGDRSTIAIDASWGLGESVVSGMVTPDNFLVNRITKDVIRRVASPKLLEYIPDAEGQKAVVMDVPPERQTALCMTDEEVQAVAILGECLDVYYHYPQDIEWALDRDLPFPRNIVALQCRPETVWSRKPRESIIRQKGGPLDFVVANLLAGVRTGLNHSRED
ncbi:MAG: phenylphosphate synthase subunit beta [Chloroflexi bacterium]|nr:phenylphosphate synthase subunit beta [Chloroflexota bacterium]